MKHFTISTWVSLLALVVVSCTPIRKDGKLSLSPNFSPAQLSLVNAGDTATPMRVYKITNYNDSLLLRKASEDVIAIPNDPYLKLFVKRLFTTVRDSMSLGVGIAAPQVGILKRVIWVQRFDKENLPFEVYLNPKIVYYSDSKQAVAEGCLSIPNRREMLNSRSQTIEIQYNKMDGTFQKETVEGFTAVIFQHEIDHLDGILYIDHLEKEIRDAKE